MKKANFINTSFFAILFLFASRLLGQNCPNASTYCSGATLLCGSSLLNTQVCGLVNRDNWTGDECNEQCGTLDNPVYYAFMTNGEGFSVTLTYTNCQSVYQDIKGLKMGIYDDCCGGNGLACTPSPTQPIPPVVSVTANLNNTVSCKVYYLFVDGYFGSYCDYTISTNSSYTLAPLVLRQINNDPSPEINLKRGACNQKFTVEPRDAPCEGYYEWTFDGNVINDHDREIRLNFPNEGDFELCVFGYSGTPALNCGISNTVCKTIKVRQDHFNGTARYLCNEQKGYRWHQKIINSSGFYTQEFYGNCEIYDSIVEFVLLPKPVAGVINYVSCNKNEPYYDPVQKQRYYSCENNHPIPIPKSTEIYSCDSSYKLNFAILDLKATMHLACKAGNVYLVPDVTLPQDTCKLGLETLYTYSWYEKINNDLEFITNGAELKVIKKGNYQLQVILHYKLNTETGSCTFVFDENIDEDVYLQFANTGALIGKHQVCKGDLECYSVNDIVKNPFGFTWIVEEGTIQTPDPNTKDIICVQWNKNSMMNSGKICVNYSDSCTSNRKACLDISFGKSNKDIAGTDQQVGGVLGTKMNAKGQKGLWTYAGGAGTVIFIDPTDPRTKVRVSRFGSYMFRWTIMEDGCEIYDTVTVNFYIEFPQLEGEYYKQNYIREEINPFDNVHVDYIDNNLNFRGKAPAPASISFHVMNLHGQVLYSAELQSIEHEFARNVNLSLMPGIYYLVLENNKDFKVSRFTVF